MSYDDNFKVEGNDVIQLSTNSGKEHTLQLPINTRNLTILKEYIEQEIGIPIGSQLLLTKQGDIVDEETLIANNFVYVDNMKALSDDEHLYIAYDCNEQLKVHTSKAIVDSLVKKVKICNKFINKQQITLDGLSASYHYFNRHTRDTLKTAEEWKSSVDKIIQQGNNLLEKQDDTLNALKSMELNKTLQTSSLQILLDVVTPDAFINAYQNLRDSLEELHKEYSTIIAQLKELEQRRQNLENTKILSIDFKKQIIEIEQEITKYSEKSIAVQEQKIKDIQELDNRITNIIHQKLSCNTAEIAVQKLRSIKTIWNDLVSYEKLINVDCSEAVRRHNEKIRVVKIMSLLPNFYEICIGEIKRRIGWGQCYRQELDKLQQQLRALIKHEVEKRSEFYRVYKKYCGNYANFSVLFPGLTQRLPFPQIQVEDFDTELPKLDGEPDVVLYLSQGRTPDGSRRLEDDNTCLRKDDEQLIHQVKSVPDVPQSPNIKQEVTDSDESNKLLKELSYLKEELQKSQTHLQIAQKTVIVTRQIHGELQAQLENEKNQTEKNLKMMLVQLKIEKAEIEQVLFRKIHELEDTINQSDVKAFELQQKYENINSQNSKLHDLLNYYDVLFEYLASDRTNTKPPTTELPLDDRLTRFNNFATQIENKFGIQKKLFEQKEEQIQVNKNRVNSLEIEVSQLQSENSRIQMENSKLIDEVSQFQSENSRTQIEKSKLNNELSQLQSENSQIQMEKLKLNNEVSRLQFEKSKLDDDVSQLQRENSQIQMEKSKLIDDISQLQSDNSQIQMDKLKLNDEVSRLQLEKAKLLDEVSRLHSENYQLQMDKYILNDEVSQLLNEKSRLQMEKSQFHNQIRPFITQNTELKTQLISSQKKLDSLNNFNVPNIENLVSELESKIQISQSSRSPNTNITTRVEVLLQNMKQVISTPPNSLSLGGYMFGHLVVAKPNQHGFMELVHTWSGSPFYFVYHNENPLVIKNNKFTNNGAKFKLYQNNAMYGRIVFLEKQPNAGVNNNPLQLPIGAEHYLVYLEPVGEDLGVLLGNK